MPEVATEPVYGQVVLQRIDDEVVVLEAPEYALFDLSLLTHPDVNGLCKVHLPGGITYAVTGMIEESYGTVLTGKLEE